MESKSQINRELARSSEWLGRYFEIELAHIYRKVLAQGGDAIDGGANSGLHSIGMGHILKGRSNTVISIEPQGDLISAGRNWAQIVNLLDKIHFAETAIGAEEGKVSFFINDNDKALSSLAKPIDPMSSPREVTVPLTTIDRLSEELDVRFVKLDLEGGEYHALLGARETIERCRPVVAFENSLVWASKLFGYDPNSIYSFFDELDYEIYDFYGKPVGGDTKSDGEYTFMFIAFPQNMKSEIRGYIEDFWKIADRYDVSEWKRTIFYIEDVCQGKI